MVSLKAPLAEEQDLLEALPHIPIVGLGGRRGGEGGDGGEDFCMGGGSEGQLRALSGLPEQPPNGLEALLQHEQMAPAGR